MERKHLNFINIVPVYPDDTAFTLSEIHRQYRDVHLRRFALSLSLHPAGTPARERLPRLMAAARAVFDGVKDLPIDLGVLIQSTLGHGWSGPVPLTDEPWQKIIRIDGKTSSRQCPADPDFQKYVFDAVEDVMKLNPDFLLLDDDFGLRASECVCPIHLKMLNEETGRNFTQEQLAELIQTAPVDDPVVKVFSRQRDDLIIQFAKDIRAVIDRYNPRIVCTMCTPGGGHSFINAVAHALAGAGASPSVRVNNSIYGCKSPFCFMGQVCTTNRIRYQLTDVPDVIDEADTFPQNYYSENAAFFHTHLTNAILNGLTGAKLWMSEFVQPVDTGSQKKYETLFAENQGFYEELYNTVQSLKWTGVKGILTRPENMNHPIQTSRALGETDWLVEVVMPFACPVAFDDGAQGGIYALTENVVKRLSDDQLRHLFAQSLLVDSLAAKELTRRGFAPLMGVRTEDDPAFFFNGEWREGMPIPLGLMWDESAAKLECVSDEAKIFTWCTGGDSRSHSFKPVTPCMVGFQNSLGGRVVTCAWTYAMPYYKTLRPLRRTLLLDALTFLNGTPLDMVLDADQQVIVRHGVIDEATDLAALISVTVDPVPAIRLSLAKTAIAVSMLAPSGEWLPVPFHHDGAILTVHRPLELCKPVILKIERH